MTGFELVAGGKLLLAVLLGALVGIERQIHGRPAGLRTHILVCVGSTLIIVVGQALGPQVDPGRAVAGIVTGIGFLGAGVIIKSKDIVRGLTTAACIWFVAGIGIAIGEGLYAVAGVATGIAMIVLIMFGWVAHRLPNANYHTVVVRGTFQDAKELERACRDRLTGSGYLVVNASGRLDRAGDSVELTLRLQTRGRGQGMETGHALMTIPQVLEVVWN